MPPHLARFAETHGAWSRKLLPVEDLLAAMADFVWKGQRLDDLDSQVIDGIAELKSLLQEIGSRGEERRAWQARR